MAEEPVYLEFPLYESESSREELVNLTDMYQLEEIRRLPAYVMHEGRRVPKLRYIEAVKGREWLRNMLYELHHEWHAGTSTIADFLGVATRTVYDWMERLGIEVIGLTKRRLPPAVGRLGVVPIGLVRRDPHLMYIPQYERAVRVHYVRPTPELAYYLGFVFGDGAMRATGTVGVIQKRVVHEEDRTYVYHELRRRFAKVAAQYRRDLAAVQVKGHPPHVYEYFWREGRPRRHRRRIYIPLERVEAIEEADYFEVGIACSYIIGTLYAFGRVDRGRGVNWHTLRYLLIDRPELAPVALAGLWDADGWVTPDNIFMIKQAVPRNQPIIDMLVELAGRRGIGYSTAYLERYEREVITGNGRVVKVWGPAVQFYFHKEPGYYRLVAEMKPWLIRRALAEGAERVIEEGRRRGYL